MSNEVKLDVFIDNSSWKAVQETLDTLTTKSPDEVKSWFVPTAYVSAYTQVYICCAPPGTFSPTENYVRAEYFRGKLIYQRLKMYMAERYEKVSLSIKSKKTPEEAFNCYMHAHLAFETNRKMIEKTFDYIQQQWINMVKRSSLSNRGKLLSIEKLLISLWLQLVVQPNLSLLLNGARTELRKIRELKLQETRVVDFAGFISSYSQDQELPQCATIYESLVGIFV